MCMHLEETMKVVKSLLVTYACVGVNKVIHVFNLSSLSSDIGGHQTHHNLEGVTMVFCS